MNDPELTPLSSMKSFALSFSDRIIEGAKKETGITGDFADEIDWNAVSNQRDHGKTQAEAADEGNFIGLASLLRHCHQLADLELFHYRLMPTARVDLHSERFLQRIAETAPLSLLQNLTLRGFAVRDQDMLALAKNAPLRKVSLENVGVTSGSFRSVFDYCTSDAAGIERLQFDDLFETGLIQFDEPGKLKFCAWDTPRSNTLDRSGAEVRQAIFYEVPQGHVPDNPALRRWRQERRRVYGPTQSTR